MKVAVSKLLQSRHTALPITVTPVPNVIFVKPLHPWKTFEPKLVTVLGTVTLPERPLFKKTLFAIDVTVLGILNEFKDEHPAKVRLSISDTPLPSVTLDRFSQFSNADAPNDVTLFGIVILEIAVP